MRFIQIFCDVIDNYGDIGFCLRLARDLCLKRLKITLFCNNLEALNKIYDYKNDENENLSIKEWPVNGSAYQPADTVIEAFSCRPPEFVISKFNESKCLVINLDYLSAEDWIESCHCRPSFSNGYKSYFFFPGFTKNSGGLIIEDCFKKNILEESAKKQVTDAELKVSLFTYENNNVYEFLKVISDSKRSFNITVFKGLPLDNLNRLLNTDLRAGDIYQSNNIRFTVRDMVSQNEYDNLLIGSDINLVRGEDSIVRAMLCGKPFLWQIYRQDDGAHITKLNAFYEKMEKFIPDQKENINLLRNYNLSYIGEGNYLDSLKFDDFYPEWCDITKKWSSYLLSLGSLTNNLIDFIRINQVK